MSRTERAWALAAATCLVLAAGACGDSNASPPAPPTQNLVDRIVGTWVLRNVNAMPTRFPPATELTLEVRADGTFTAYDTCNPQLGHWQPSSDRGAQSDTVEFFDVMRPALLCPENPDVIPGYMVSGRLNRDASGLVVDRATGTATYARR